MRCCNEHLQCDNTIYKKECLADFLDGYDINYSEDDYFIVID